MAAREIERKFRVRKTPKLKGLRGTDIRQGYLVTHAGELRVRQAGSKYFITVKGEGGLSRKEWEQRIPRWVFELLWPHTSGRRIEKRRYQLRADGNDCELDVYDGPLKGLVVLECEFSSKKKAGKFQPPKKLRAVDVTGDSEYRNRNLAAATAPPASPR